MTVMNVMEVMAGMVAAPTAGPPTDTVLAASWGDTLRDRPLASIVAGSVVLVAAVGAGLALRALTRRTRRLRSLVLAIAIAALAVGAIAAIALGRLMVLEAGEARSALGVLAVTAIVAIVLTVIASAPLGRDAARLEDAVRRLEAGDRTARTGVDRRDELGHVARALDELTERLDALERERAAIEDERRRTFASVGHDLRTPLSALRAAVEALADGVAPDPERYVRSMARDVEALGSLIDDVFLLATIESGRLDLVREPVDLGELADEAVEALTPAANAKAVTLGLRAPGSVRVDGNARAISRVLRNLVDNAIRHSPEGGSVEVVVEATPTPTVRVIDGGSGFSPEFARRAFEPFARADASRARATGGAGLGLVIARGLVEAHGGRIWIEPPAPDAGGGRVAFAIPALAADA